MHLLLNNMLELLLILQELFYLKNNEISMLKDLWFQHNINILFFNLWKSLNCPLYRCIWDLEAISTASQ